MKTLLFLRHGKSDWDADYLHDHERPLAKRGRKAAKRMGELLAAWDQAPDSVITSPAVRAHDTLRRAHDAGGWEAPVRVSDRLYEGGPADLLDEIRREPDTTRALMLVGHEPTWSDTVSRFIGGGTIRFPTAAVACLRLEIEQWRSARFGDAELVWFVPPRLVS